MNAQASRRLKGRFPIFRVLCLLPVLLVAPTLPQSGAAQDEDAFDDPLFRRCVRWLLDGTGGAMIGNLCIDQYDFPPPSLFICARKVRTGFPSAQDQEGCAVLFEEQAKKVRAGYIR